MATKVKALYAAIVAQNYDTVSEMMLKDPMLVQQTYQSRCRTPECECIETVSPITTLFRVKEWSVNEERGQALALLEKLFVNGLLTTDNVTDDALYEAVSSHCGWTINDKLLDLLIEYIPKERWVTLRKTDSYSEDGDEKHYTMSILHAITQGYMGDNEYKKYFKIFFDMGVDPTFSVNDTKPVQHLIQHAQHELLTMIVEKQGNNCPIDVNLIDDFTGKTQLAKVLAWSDADKRKHIKDVRGIVQFCIKQGLNVDDYSYVPRDEWAKYTN